MSTVNTRTDSKLVFETILKVIGKEEAALFARSATAGRQ
jgi:hypothetical protein